jgi:hypothetical protein
LHLHPRRGGPTLCRHLFTYELRVAWCAGARCILHGWLAGCSADDEQPECATRRTASKRRGRSRAVQPRPTHSSQPRLRAPGAKSHSQAVFCRVTVACAHVLAHTEVSTLGGDPYGGGAVRVMVRHNRDGRKHGSRSKRRARASEPSLRFEPHGMSYVACCSLSIVC